MNLLTGAELKSVEGFFNGIKHHMKLITTSEAAEILGVSTARVRAMILAGRLRAEKFGHVHMIHEEDLALVTERKPGRPKKAQDAATTEPRVKAAKKARKSAKKD